MGLRSLPEFVPEPEPAPVIFEKHSIADYKIIYGEDATEAEANAANILANTLNQITDLDYAAVQSVPSGGKEILVGQIGGVDVSELGNDGYVIKAEGESIYIAGGRPRGTFYGVHRFLEEYFGCRWYSEHFQAIPKGPAEIAEVKDERYTPPLEFRDMDWFFYSAGKYYSAANGLNGNTHGGLPMAEELGGSFGYNGSCAHSMTSFFVKSEDFFDVHPEWYAYRESSKSRVSSHLCLTNPEVLAQMILEVRNQLENGNGEPIVSVTQEDNDFYCQCANCKAVDREEGSQAGTMISFVNAVAADIVQDYPDALIDTFAYRHTRKPPKHVRPLPNVVVRLCSIECCFAHPLDDPKCPDNVQFARDIRGWSEICERLYVWDYTMNIFCYHVMHPNFQVLQKNMQFFLEHNVKDVFEQGNGTCDLSDSEFALLRGYLLARLLWNPNLDYDAEMNGLLEDYYGGGWQYMREFIDLMSRNAGKPALFGLWHRKLGIGTFPNNKAILDLKPNQVAYADRLWEKAINLAGDETSEQHVLRSQLSWRFWKSSNRAGEFSRWQLPAKWQAENERLYNDMRAFGITNYSENVGGGNNWRFLQETPDSWWGTPYRWRG